MTRGRLAGGLAVVAVASLWLVALPPRAQPAGAGPGPPVVRGALHVHSIRSDGSGRVDDIARAAAAAGLQFVIVTDHGDGAGGGDVPTYRQGVLCIDAVEISTEGGHVVALGMETAPYPLGGEARDVLEDVRRLGGFSIAAHPDSAHPDLRWRDLDLPFDALEWLNGDSQWRDESWLALARAAATYPVRPVETLTALLDRPDDLLARWEALTATRAIVAVAASDAHARLGLGSRVAIPLPSYEQMFRSLSLVLPGVRLSGDARADAELVLGAIRAGHTYSAIDGLATPARLTFSATATGVDAAGGDIVAEQPLTFRVTSNAPAGARVLLLRGGTLVAAADGASLEHAASAPGAYRVEIRLPVPAHATPAPWVLSNPIYVGHVASQFVDKTSRPDATSFTRVYDDGPADLWRIEANPRSQGTIEAVATADGQQLTLRYALGGTRSESPFVAAVTAPGPAVAGARVLAFMARAARPMRISVQLRSAAGVRWRRSVYLDDAPRVHVIRLSEMTAVDAAPADAAPGADGQLLFVVDTRNTPPGTNGQIWIDDIRLGR